MFSGPVEDRLAIRELLDAYADAVCRMNATDWAATWAEDADWTVMGNDVSGRDAIVGFWQQAMAGFEAASFMSVPGMIVVEGNRATGRSQTQEILKSAQGTQIIGGLYQDGFVKVDGTWLFQSRKHEVISIYPEL